MAGSRPHQATVEEYHSSTDDSSDHDSVVETFRRSPAAPGQANVAAKRSHPSDLGTDKSPAAEKVGNIDLQSDSGYSSHTAATMSSADSGPSAKSQSPPIAPLSAALESAPPASPAPRRRPTLGRDDRHSTTTTTTTSSPRKPLARSGSVSSRIRPSRERQPPAPATEDCTDPNCTQCVPPLPVRGRRPRPSPHDSGLDISSLPIDQRSQRSDPAPTSSYAPPPSPTYSRPPDHYRRGLALLQPAQTARARRSSSAARPVSYSGEPPAGYWVPGMPNMPAMMGSYPSPPQEQHGPPPAMSAYHGMHQMNGYGMVGATPPNNFYPGLPQQTSPPYDMQRLPMPSRNSSNFNARRPSSQVYGPPLLTQDNTVGSMPSARYPSNTPSSATQRGLPQSSYESESSDSDYAEEENNDRALMPPPKLMTPSQRRPSLRQANTYGPERRMSLMSQSLTLEPSRERERERDPRVARLSTTAAPSRSASVSRTRPALVQHPKAQSAFETARNAQVMVENSRTRRPLSYQSYDTSYAEPDRRSKTYKDESVRLPSNRRRQTDAIEPDRRPKMDRDDAIALRNHRRRQTDASLQRRDENSDQSKWRETTDDVEAYLQRTRGSEAPFNDQVHKAAKRASRVPSGPSDTGSSRSKGSDKASRISQSNRTTVTNGGGGEIRLRVDASAALSLQLNGDMEGRTLQINPAEGGMADIVIGNANGNESTYRSEKGSVFGSSRKTVISRAERSERARRDADDASMRSSRGSQGRRERDGEMRPLRRKSELRYQ